MAKGMTARDMTLATPQFMAEPISGHIVAGGVKLDASAFPYTGSTIEVTANAIADAETISVVALPVAIPIHTVLYFGADKYARLTAAAAKGATSISVEALTTAIDDGDTATYNADGNKKMVKAGTLVGRTFAEAATSDAYGPAADADDEVFLVAFDIYDVNEDNDASLIKGNVVIFQNYLPEYDNLSATLLGKLRAKYICKMGVA